MPIKNWMSWEGGVDLVAMTKPGLSMPNVILHVARMVHTPPLIGVTSVPVTAHVLEVNAVKVTLKPDEAVAVIAKGGSLTG